PLPARWRLRIPRPVAGCAVVALFAAGPLSRTSPARRLAAVRRGRRAALVAPAERTRHSHALFGRPALAAVRRGDLRRTHRRPGGARRAHPVSRGTAAHGGPARGVRPA